MPPTAKKVEVTAEDVFDKKVEETVIALTEKHRDKTTAVHAVVFMDNETNERIAGYFMEPKRVVQLRVMDRSIREPYSAAAELLEVVFLKEESDPRFLSVDEHYRGLVAVLRNAMAYSANLFKKK